MGAVKATRSKQPVKKRVVSSPRSKTPKEPVSIRLTAAQISKLDAAATHRHRSRSDLIVQAINRCQADDVWTSGEGRDVSGNGGRGPQDQLVDLANILVSLGFAAREAIEARSASRKQQALRVLEEAQRKLDEVMTELQC